MTRRKSYGPSIGNIIHPTDFSHGSDVAFTHALRLAVDMKGSLEILHVDDKDSRRPDWDRFPSVRGTLVGWGLMQEGAAKSAVAELGVRVTKSACRSDQTADMVVERIERHGAELVVMATHQREGLNRLIHKSVAENVVEKSGTAALLIPYGVNGFVKPDSGKTSLKRILIPVDKNPDPQPGVETIAQLVELVAKQTVEIRLLHIGDPADMPSLTLPGSKYSKWIWDSRISGDVAGEIVSYADEYKIDLIAMTTMGHDGFMDVLRGSTTERVLAQAQCPVLAIHEPSEDE